MNLRSKLLLGIGLALISTFALGSVFSYYSMEADYRSLEDKDIRRAADISLNALNSDLKNTYSVTRDYAAWTDTYRYAEGENPGWTVQNTADDFFTRFSINYILVFNRSGQLLLGEGFDLSMNRPEPVPVSLVPEIQNITISDGFLSSPDGKYGLFHSTEGLFIVSIHPILHDNFTGPPAGSLVLVRRIDDRYLADLASRAGYVITLVPAGTVAGRDPLAGIVSRITPASPVAVAVEDNDFSAGYSLVSDMNDSAGLYLKTTTPRTLYQAGQASIFTFLSTLAVAGIFITAFVLLFVDRVVLSRLNTIISTVRKRREGGDHDVSHARSSGDEITRLALEIDPVFAQLARSRSELLDSEERYRTLAESARDFIYIIGRDDRVMYVNSSAAAALGRSLNEIIGQPRSALFRNPENRQQHASIVKVFTSGEPLKIESRIPLPAGEIWYDTLLVPIRRSDGTITGVMGVSRDISGHKKAEEALRQSEHRYHELFELGGEAIFLIDNTTGRILEANDGATEMYGYSHTELLAMKNTDLSDEPEETGRTTTTSPAGAVVVPLRHHRKKDGTVFPVEIHGRFFVSENKSVHVAAIRDITHRIQAENTLRESNERFRTVMDSLDSLVYVSDMNTHEILFLNQHGRNAWGDVTGRICWQTFHAGQTGPCPFCTNGRLLDSADEPAKTIVWEYKNTVNGRWYECRDRAIRWIDGRLVRLEIATDITDRKHAEDALLKVNRKLNLLSSVTRHDIINQLTALRAYIELSNDHAKNEIISDFIRKELKIADMIDRQITFTRDYHDLGVKAPIWDNIADIITRAQQEHILRNVKVTTDFSDIEVLADPLLEKVFCNLIVNSLRYGGPKLSTIRFSVKKNGESLVIICEDDGAGIKDEEKKLIFDRGYGHNTGLGLFLSREILGITEAIITETGTFGKGARFEITFPKGSFRFIGQEEEP